MLGNGYIEEMMRGAGVNQAVKQATAEAQTVPAPAPAPQMDMLTALTGSTAAPAPAPAPQSDILAALTDPTGGSYVPQNATVDASTNQPRKEGWGMTDRAGSADPVWPLQNEGPLSTAAKAAVPSVDTGTGSPADLAAQQTIAGYRTQLKGNALADSQYAQDREARGVAANNEGNRARALETATGDARVANWKATNGVGVALRGQTFHGQNAEQNAAIAASQSANARVASLQTPLPIPEGMSPIDAFAKSQEAAGVPGKVEQGRLAGQQALQAGAVDLAGKKLDVAAKQRIDTIGAQLADPNLDPKKVSQLHSSLLALLGKDKPEDYQVIHAPGATHVNPQTFQVEKEPDHVVVVNKRTGQAQVVPLGAAGAAATGPKPALDAFLKQAKAANPDKSIDELTKFYTEKYGK